MAVPEVPVSVIIPAYNAESWIARCLASVFTSTVRPSEVIVVDDGSTDATSRIAGRIAGVTVVRQDNMGLPAARNRGISAANREWIAMLDADDEWHPRKLELQWELIERAPRVDCVFTDYDELTEKTGRLHRNLLSWHWNYRDLVKYPVTPSGFVFDPDTFAAEWPKWNFLNASSVLVRRDRVLGVGGFNHDISHCEDYEFFLRYAKDARFGVVELPLVLYRRHPGQMSREHIKMARAFVDVSRRVAAHPERYHPRSVETLSAFVATFLGEAAALEALHAPRSALMHGIAALRVSRSPAFVAITVMRALVRRSGLRGLRRLPFLRRFSRGHVPSLVQGTGFPAPWRPHCGAVA